MGARLFQVRRLAGVAFMAALAALCMAATGGPYLPGLGPVPLRFAVKTTPPAVVSFQVAPQDSSLTGNSDTGSSDVAHVASLVAPTNAVASGPEVLTTENRVADPSSAGKAPPSYLFASPMVGMTPQVLAEFFQPVAGRTNAPVTALFVPVDVSFTPPVPKAGASSRATYRIQ